MMSEKCLIGDVAQLFNISSDTLRYYEKVGILSPKKNINGYRHYGMDDIIRLIDIMFYRGLDIAIKDIAAITTSMDMGEIIQVMTENENIMADKIRKMQVLQGKLQLAKKRFMTAEQQLGLCQIVEPPDFKYAICYDQDNENMLADMNEYKKINEDWIDSLLFAIYLQQDIFAGTRTLADAHYGIIIENSKIINSGNPEEYQEFNSFADHEYLYTIIKTTYDEEENQYLMQAREWLTLNQRVCIGDVIGRYLATSYESHRTMDYYEIWIPIK